MTTNTTGRTMTFEAILVKADGPVTTITLNQLEPRRNSLSELMVTELKAAFAAIAADASCRVVILTGSGRVFSSGGDLARADAVDATPLYISRKVRQGTGLVEVITGLAQPVIAAVNGAAVGAGCNLALACDLIVASETARFGQLYLQRGMGLDWGGSWLLPRLVGLHRAKEFAFWPELISVARAAEMGLVNRVVPADDLADVAFEMASMIARNAPVPMAGAKRALNRSADLTISLALDEEAQAAGLVWSTADAQEGLRSYLEKRDPKFEGV